ncbi:MAG: heparan-alpha-glucosaminide N-acetyltransferase domain-containing protein, partial [Promethearchaeia archaeon]
MSALEDYIKDLNRLESARQRDKKYQRIRSIDFVKGFAICLIVLAHISGAWVNDEWRWVYGLVYAVLDVFGPSLFIFLSALSVIFSLRKKMGFLPKKNIRNAVFLRGVIIMVLGVLYNLIAVKSVPFPLNLWGWNILMFIGFSQIICYLALKFSRGARIGIGIMAVYITPLLRDFLYFGKDTSPIIWFFHYLLVS